MAYGDKYWSNVRKKEHVKTLDTSGGIADSMEVRMALIKKMEAGDMALAEVQEELARIKRTAKRNGKITRAQAWREG